MARAFLVMLSFLFVTVPPKLFAKVETSRITITGPDLKGPIEITDPKALANFNVWTGAGTSWTGPAAATQDVHGFVIDWSQAVVADPPKGLTRYQVSFYAKLPDERLVYVVFYEYDPAADHGYVYLPGKNDDWYRLNIGTIFRRVEGHWFIASKTWELVARPLIATAKVTAGSKPPA
jgi:hypothetical protein